MLIIFNKKLRIIKRLLKRYLNKINNLFSHLSNKDIEIEIYEKIIVYPLQELTYHNYVGGLINSKSNRLIKTAVFRDNEGKICQHIHNFNAQEVLSKDFLKIQDTCLYGGFLYNHFGHFLVESLGRLWAYKYVKELDPYICFYVPWGVPDYLDKNNYVNQTLTGFKIPLKKLIFFNDLIQLKKVIIPHQKYDYCRNPDYIFSEFIKNFSFDESVPEGFENADKIYVSRANLPFASSNNCIHGRAIGEITFEQYLLSNGYQIFYPELYSLFQQLTVYNNAKKIIFSSGSALHTCILIPNFQADVAIISRYSNPEENLLFAEQFQGYGKAVFWIYAVRAQYQFGLPSWAALSDIDWYKASILLEKYGFVDAVFNTFNPTDHSKSVRSEIQNYIQSMASSNLLNGKFSLMDYMT